MLLFQMLAKIIENDNLFTIRTWHLLKNTTLIMCIQSIQFCRNFIKATIFGIDTWVSFESRQNLHKFSFFGKSWNFWIYALMLTERAFSSTAFATQNFFCRKHSAWFQCQVLGKCYIACKLTYSWKPPKHRNRFFFLNYPFFTRSNSENWNKFRNLLTFAMPLLALSCIDPALDHQTQRSNMIRPSVNVFKLLGGKESYF